MSSSYQPSERSRLDEYLDGTMPVHEREEFAREIAANPQLKAEIELQNQINQSLSRRYVPPVAPANLGQILKDSAPPESSPSTGKSGTGKLGASGGPVIGAAVAVIAIWGGLFWYLFGPGPSQPAPIPRVVELVSPYRQATETGFQPTTKPNNSQEFTKIFSDQFGRGLRIKSLPPGCKILGVTQVDACGGSSFPISIYANVDGKPVMVFVRARVSDVAPPEEPSAESKLKMFRKEMGPLVLYEVTPLEKAKAVETFELAEETPPKQ